MCKKVKRIYISGPITGTDDFMERFNAAEAVLRDDGHTVINPAKISADLPSDLSHDDYMRVSIALLGLCDGIYMLDGWENSPGANMEIGYAIGAGMKVMHE